MTQTQKITVAEVKASINPDIKVHPSVTWFGRPIGDLITPFFHNTGWNANKLTIARTYLAFVGVAMLAVPVPILWQISAVIYFFCFILDCVDGNLARIQNDATYLGKFLDGLADAVYAFSATFFLGIGTWLYYDEPRLLIVGAGISIISLGNHMLRNRLSFFREWMVSLTGELTEQELANAQEARKFQDVLAIVAVNGYFLAIFALLLPHWGATIFLGVCLVTQTLPDLIWISTSMAEAGALLRRGRISKHARIDPLGE